MCTQCYGALVEYFSHLTDKEKIRILWSATAFPAGCGETVVRQLKEAREATDGSFEAVMDRAESIMDRAMREKGR